MTQPPRTSTETGSIVDIEAIYRGDPEIPVDTTIAFQDGTRQRIRTTLKVVRMIERASMPLAAE